MLLVEQSLVAGRRIIPVEHSMQPMTKPNSNTYPSDKIFKTFIPICAKIHAACYTADNPRDAKDEDMETCQLLEEFFMNKNGWSHGKWAEFHAREIQI